MASSKRVLIVGCAMIFALVFVACGGGAGDEGGNGDATSLRFANIYEAGHPFNECGAEVMAEQVSSESGGAVAVNNFPGGQLGAEDELAESLSAQNLEMGIIGPAFLAQYDERLGVLDAAYLFEGVEHMEDVTDGEIGRELWGGLLEEANMRVLGTWYYGTRQLTTGNTEVRSPEDAQGLSVRAPDAPIPLANVEALGASPTPLSFEEVYLGLQQGTVDGQENPITTIASENFNEVQDYLMLTEHVVQSTQIVIAENSWESLESEQQEALQQAIDSATEEVRDCIESSEEETIAEWEEAGQPEIIEDIDIEAFRQIAQEELPEQFQDQWGDLYERIQQEGAQ